MALVFNDNDRVLFQGDSITDWGRSRTDDNNLGGGYAAMCAAWISAAYPARKITFLNRGISGNRACDLKARWQADCIDLKPNWVSILIGINDTWRAFDSNSPTTAEAYEVDYRAILTDARAKLDAKFILCEPFVLPCPPDREKWRLDLDAKINAARKLAREFEAIFVPFDGLFAAAATQREPAFWAGDGVHPSAAGNALMTQAWLRAVGAL